VKENISATFQIEEWDEKSFSEIEQGEKLTRVLVTKTFKGDMEGKSVLEYLMAYRSDGSAVFTGLERIEGKIKDRYGSFVLWHEGEYKSGVVKTTFSGVPGTGTNELTGIVGEGGFESSHQPEYAIDFSYELENQA